MSESTRLLAESAAEWAVNRHYEAHELLEDVAECFEAEDPSFEIAMAFVHIAAAFHKVIHDVGPKAAPGKIRRALEVLDRAPAEWLGVDVATFRNDTRNVLEKLERGVAVDAFPVLAITPSEPGSS